jgi:hypothetical protein
MYCFIVFQCVSTLQTGSKGMMSRDDEQIFGMAQNQQPGGVSF